MCGDGNEIDLRARETFTRWTPVTIRFSDQDPLRHVNNCAIAAYVEAGRTMLIQPFLDGENHPHLDFALVNLEISFLAEFRYPGTVDVGGCIVRLGRTSFTTGYGLFVDDLCVATSTCVNVFFDTEKRQGVEPPAGIRAAMSEAMSSR